MTPRVRAALDPPGQAPNGSPPEQPADARAATRRYYQDHAAAYAARSLDADLRPVWEPFEARLSPAALVVDLGCGAGRDLRRFAGQGFAPVGLDRSYPLCQIAREVGGRPVAAGDLTALPFRDAAFDGVWAAASVLHLDAADAALAFAEMYRVVRPGGTATVTLKEGSGADTDADGRWTLHYTEEGARSALAQAGFCDIRCRRTWERRAGREIAWLALHAQHGRGRAPAACGA